MLPLRTWLVAAASFTLLTATSSSASAPSYLPTGLYVLVPSNSTVDNAVLASHAVSGLQIRATWKRLQPTPGAPDFSYFDALIQAAKHKGKKVIIAVGRGLAGEGLPDWVAESVPLFSCSDGTEAPVLWDRTYQQAWIDLWTQLVRRYDKEPAVSGYHVGGIYSWKLPDWDLCDATEEDRNAWLDAGYQIAFVKAFALAFFDALTRTTTKPFVLPVAGTMDDEGDVNTATTRIHVMDPLFRCYGPAPIPSGDCPAPRSRRVGFMRTVFRDTTPDPARIWNTAALGEQFGTLYQFRPHIAGQRDPITYTAASLKVMADISLHYDVQFMELGAAEVKLAGAASLLACYRAALESGVSGRHCGH